MKFVNGDRVRVKYSFGEMTGKYLESAGKHEGRLRARVLFDQKFGGFYDTVFQAQIEKIKENTNEVF